VGDTVCNIRDEGRTLVAGGMLFGIVTCFNGTFSRKSAKKLKF
jgi:hypothetical protein